MPTTTVLSPSNRLRELEKKRFHAGRKGQIPVMDAETLRELCLDNDGYETPELNDNLCVCLPFCVSPTKYAYFAHVLYTLLPACRFARYAHFQGFQRIEGLDAYFNLKALWLESNGLTKMENLTPLVNLRCLYLSKNLIERIENLECLKELNTLDLSDNRIKTLSGLAHLPQLSSLNVSRNQLESCGDLEELAHCAQLTNVDISHNRIEDPDVLRIFQEIPQLRALRITGNAVVSKTKYFRKRYIASLPQLSFLDRPIFPIERAAVAAWQEGGNDAELEAKRAFVNKEHDERKRTLQEFRDWQAQVRAKRIKELEEERLEKQLHDKENASQNPEKDDDAGGVLSLDEIDLRGFRGITKEQYARLSPQERAKWDARIAQAHADSITEKYEVLRDDGIQKIGSKFWTAESVNAKRSDAERDDQPPVLLADNVVTEDEVHASPVNSACESESRDSTFHGELDGGLEESAVEATTKTLDALQVTPTATPINSECTAKADLQRDSVLAQSPPVVAGTPVETTPEPKAIATKDNGHDVQTPNADAAGCLLPPPAPSSVVAAASSTVYPKDPSKFFREVGDVRETWAQLEQRARHSPFLHRPQHLPSVHTMVRHLVLALLHMSLSIEIMVH